MCIRDSTWITSLTGTSTFASVALVCTQPLFVAFFSYVLFRERTPRRALPGALLADVYKRQDPG